MLKVGITGQAGFIGTHLFNYLNLKKDEIITVPFWDSYFENDNLLTDFVNECDVIVHLAAMNRHGDPQVIYDTNIKLVKQLIAALEESSKKFMCFSHPQLRKRETIFMVSPNMTAGCSLNNGPEKIIAALRDS